MDASPRLARYLSGLAFLLTLLLVAVPAPGAQQLFEAEVPVASQEPAQRATAMKQALAEVLVRVTGHRPGRLRGPRLCQGLRRGRR